MGAVGRRKVLSGGPIRYGVLVGLAMLVFFAWQQARAQDALKTAKPAGSGNAENGKRLFISDGCYECHGRAGQGSAYSGVRLAPKPINLDAFIMYVREPAGQMPPYTAKVISDAELADVRAYLNSLPEPPPVKSVPLLN
jgi:ubiquinol-cytochrome c reductase cytochrome c subunit